MFDVLPVSLRLFVIAAVLIGRVGRADDQAGAAVGGEVRHPVVPGFERFHAGGDRTMQSTRSRAASRSWASWAARRAMPPARRSPARSSRSRHRSSTRLAAGCGRAISARS